jgi:hypothetical protein
VPAPGDAVPRWELAAGVLARLGTPLGAATAREVFALVAKATPDYGSLDYRAVGPQGRALPSADAAAPAQEARA